MDVFYAKPMFPDSTDPEQKEILVYHSKVDGGYVGVEEKVAFLEEHGICPQLSSPNHKVCSIGYNHLEEKWYGWSHRAMASFGIGSEVKRGDIAYVPMDMEDARREAIRFWEDKWHLDVQADLPCEDDVVPRFTVRWTYSEDTPKAALRGTTGTVHHYPPKEWGHGEWTAKTLQDAKQMACDFAENVS